MGTPKTSNLGFDAAEGSFAMQCATRMDIAEPAVRDFQEGVSWLEAGDPAKAAVLFSRSVECAPQFTEGHMMLGIAYAMNSNIYPAIDHLQLASELGDTSFAPRYFLAQLYFKLRIPQKGFEAAEQALRCATSPQERRLLSTLLHDEKQREHSGIARPWFNKPFSVPAVFVAGSGLAAALLALLIHLR